MRNFIDTLLSIEFIDFVTDRTYKSVFFYMYIYKNKKKHILFKKV